MTDTPIASFDADTIRFVGLVHLVAARDGIPVDGPDGASERVARLLSSPEVVAEAAADRAAEAEVAAAPAKLVAIRQHLVDLVAGIDAAGQ